MLGSVSKAYEEPTQGGKVGGRTSLVCTVISRITIGIVEEEGAQERRGAEYRLAMVSSCWISIIFLLIILRRRLD